MEAKKVTIEGLHENSLRGKARRTLMVTSGASSASLIEDEPFYFVHGGRETDAFEVGGESKFIVCFSGIEPFKKPGLSDWRRCLWGGHNFERLGSSGITLVFHWPAAAFLQPPITLSRSVVDELTPNVGSAIERISFSTSSNQESESEVLSQRGTFVLAHTQEMLFSREVELRTAELPRWKPHLAIDRRTLDRNNE
jgi:hypothetical protein